jgi:hypothetical protein
MGLAQGMEPLAALAHQRLATGQRQIAVGIEACPQLKDPLQRLILQSAGPELQLLNHKGTEPAMAALEIAEAPIRLNL